MPKRNLGLIVSLFVILPLLSVLFSKSYKPSSAQEISPTPTETYTPTPTETVTPTPTPIPLPTGIWLSKEEIMMLPTSGSGWDLVSSTANKVVSSPNLQQRDSDNTTTLAKALVCARVGVHCDEVRQILGQVMGTEFGSDILAVLRNTYAYVIAADLIDLKNTDPSFDITFRSWLVGLRTAVAGSSPCQSIINCHEKRPNNFGGHAFSSRVAIDRFLDDSFDLENAVNVHRAWLGMPGYSQSFKWGALDWQCDPLNPVGINPKGCTKGGHTIDGVLPDDQRRSGGFIWPPPCENYVWGALQGYSVGTQMLFRAGYPVWEWQDQAIKRALEWLHSPEVKSQNWCAATGDDTWVPYLVNWYYGTNFPASPSIGKGMGFTDWTHQR